MRIMCKAILAMLLVAGLVPAAHARIKLVALPDRGATTIRMDNPSATLIEEERVLTLQKGVNKVDFSWNGVSIDVDSIRLAILSHPDKVNLLNVSYPPNEQALVWEISSADAFEETVRISYLLYNIDRLITYTATADKGEKQVGLKSYLVVRNFSGEDFVKANVLMDYGSSFTESTAHEETKQLLFFKNDAVPIRKVWKFDASIQPWDPEKVDNNVGIPVTYEIENLDKSGLGKTALWGGKVRVFQDDGSGSTIILGEDNAALTPVGEKMKIYIGDSRDIVVTQRKMKDQKVNIRRNVNGGIVLYDTDELITVKMENFKDSPAVLTLVEYIPGQWEMKKCDLQFKRENSEQIEFEIEIPARGKKELTMNYTRKNLR